MKLSDDQHSSNSSLNSSSSTGEELLLVGSGFLTLPYSLNSSFLQLTFVECLPDSKTNLMNTLVFNVYSLTNFCNESVPSSILGVKDHLRSVIIMNSFCVTGAQRGRYIFAVQGIGQSLH